MTTASYLIAMGRKPKDEFIPTLKSICKQEGLDLQAAWLVPGPGCANLAIMLGEANENFVNQLTMQLQPAKWETCDDPRLKAGMFLDDVNNEAA